MSGLPQHRSRGQSDEFRFGGSYQSASADSEDEAVARLLPVPPEDAPRGRFFAAITRPSLPMRPILIVTIIFLIIIALSRRNAGESQMSVPSSASEAALQAPVHGELLESGHEFSSSPISHSINAAVEGEGDIVDDDDENDEDADVSDLAGEAALISSAASAKTSSAGTVTLAEGSKRSTKSRDLKRNLKTKSKGQDDKTKSKKGSRAADRRARKHAEAKAKYAPTAERRKVFASPSNPFTHPPPASPRASTAAHALAAAATAAAATATAANQSVAEPAPAPVPVSTPTPTPVSVPSTALPSAAPAMEHAYAAAVPVHNTTAPSNGAHHGAAPPHHATAGTAPHNTSATPAPPVGAGVALGAAAVEAAYNTSTASGAPVPPPPAPTVSGETLEAKADSLREGGFYAKGSKPHFGHLHPLSPELQNAIRFYHFSDTHIDPFFTPLQSMQPGVCHSCKLSSQVFGSDAYCPLAIPQTESSRHLHMGYAFGRFRCNPPPRLMLSLLTHLAHHNPDPDFIVITGDLAPHGLPDDNFPLDESTRLTDLCPTKFLILQQHVRQLRAFFPRTHFAFAMGNNDHFPKNVFWRPYMDKLGAMFLQEGFISQEQHADFVRIGSYAIEPRPGLRILCPDFSLFIEGGEASFVPESEWESLRPGIEQEDARFPVRAALLQWLRTQLASARSEGIAVLLIAHQPLSTNKGKDEMDIESAHFAHLKVILSEYADVIRAALFGHRNLAGLQNILGPLGEPLIPSITVPGISPRGNNQPVYHEVFLDPAHFHILEFEQWAFDLISENTIAARLAVEDELAHADAALTPAQHAAARVPGLPSAQSRPASAGGAPAHAALTQQFGSERESTMSVLSSLVSGHGASQAALEVMLETKAAPVAAMRAGSGNHATMAAAELAMHHVRDRETKRREKEGRRATVLAVKAAKAAARHAEADKAARNVAGGSSDDEQLEVVDDQIETGDALIVATSSGALGRLLAAAPGDAHVERLQMALRERIRQLRASRPAAEGTEGKDEAFVLTLSPSAEAALRPRVEAILAGRSSASTADADPEENTESSAAPIYVAVIPMSAEKEAAAEPVPVSRPASLSPASESVAEHVAAVRRMSDGEYLGRWGQLPQDLYSWRAVSGAQNYTTSTLSHFLSNAPKISRDFFAMQIWRQGGYIGLETPENFRCKAMYDEEDAMMRCLFPEQDPRCFSPVWIK